MTTLKKVPFQLVEVETIPEYYNLEEGRFYYSEKYGTASHLCACGCGYEYPIPIKPEQWKIVSKEPLTVTPSLHHRAGCCSHYIFRDGFANIVNYPKSWGSPSYDTHAPNGCPM